MRNQALIVIRRDPDEIEPHPLSLSLYGDSVSLDFVKSVRKFGVSEPIILAADGVTIVSGSRRRRAAIESHQQDVPTVTDGSLTDDLDIQERVIEANRHHEKPPELLWREAKALADIEKSRAERRMQKTQFSPQNAATQTVCGTVDGNRGEARDVVGKKLGVSRETVRKAEIVVDAIDAAEKAGDIDVASIIRAQKTIHEAYKVATYKPKHSGSAHDDTHKCPNCGCTWWLQVPGGHDCDNCGQPLGEPVGDQDEQRDRPLGDLEQAERSAEAMKDHKKARSALGVVVRYCDTIGQTKRAKPHLDALLKIVGV